MSLLLKALKKAEQQAQEKPAAPTTALAVEPTLTNQPPAPPAEIQLEPNALVFPTLEFETIDEPAVVKQIDVPSGLPELNLANEQNAPLHPAPQLDDLLTIATPAYSAPLPEPSSLKTFNLPEAPLSQDSDIEIMMSPPASAPPDAFAQAALKHVEPEQSIELPKTVTAETPIDPATPTPPKNNMADLPAKNINPAKPEAQARQFMLFKLQQLSASNDQRPGFLMALLLLGIVLGGVTFWYWSSEKSSAPISAKTTPPAQPVQDAPFSPPDSPQSSAGSIQASNTLPGAPNLNLPKNLAETQAAKPAATAGLTMQTPSKLDRPIPPAEKASLAEAPKKPSSLPQPKHELLIRKDTPSGEEGNLTLAYQSLTRGDLQEAERYYQAALQQDRLNPDIYVGLGTIALRTGKLNIADAAFRRALELNPANTYAQSMLVSMANQADPAGTASRLKALAAQTQPADGQASTFTLLGNKLAAQGLWHDAQQAYFDALNADPNNPDCAYNLAVSLEHIRQSKLAVNYYKKALELAKLRTPSFDINLANNRLIALSNLPGAR